MDDLIVLLVEEICDEDCASIVKVLLAHPNQTTESLNKQLRGKENTQSNLRILSDLLFVTTSPKSKHSVDKDRVLSHLLAPKYLQILSSIYPNAVDFEYVLAKGTTTEIMFQDCVDSGFLIPPPRNSLKKNKLEQPSYCLNFDLLDSLIISETIGKYVNSKIDTESSIVVETLFKYGNCNRWSLNELESNLPIYPVINDLAKVLENLVSDNILTVRNKLYQINIKFLGSEIKTQCIDKIILGRFSPAHLRIYKIIRKRGLLDEISISRLSMISLEDTVGILNEMEGFVSKSEISGKAYYTGNFSPSNELVFEEFWSAIYALKTSQASENAILELAKTVLILSKFL